MMFIGARAINKEIRAISLRRIGQEQDRHKENSLYDIYWRSYLIVILTLYHLRPCKDCREFGPNITCTQKKDLGSLNWQSLSWKEFLHQLVSIKTYS